VLRVEAGEPMERPVRRVEASELMERPLNREACEHMKRPKRRPGKGRDW
jgi:hypothetical protein